MLESVGTVMTPYYSSLHRNAVCQEWEGSSLLNTSPGTKAQRLH